MTWAWIACVALMVVAVLWAHGGVVDWFKDKKNKNKKKKQGKKNKQGKIEDQTIEIQKGTGSGRGKSFNATEKLNLGKADSAKATFDVQFDKGFEWGCNGKVGGLFIGPGKASGNRNKNGASVRFNWTKGGGAFAYVYTPQGTGDRQVGALQKEKKVKLFKDELRGALGGGGYKNVEIDVKLNSFSNGNANNDGELVMTVRDDKGNVKKGVQKNIIWRDNEAHSFDKMQIQPFHGGGGKECKAAKRNSSIKIKNVNVQAGNKESKKAKK